MNLEQLIFTWKGCYLVLALFASMLCFTKLCNLFEEEIKTPPLQTNIPCSKFITDPLDQSCELICNFLYYQH